MKKLIVMAVLLIAIGSVTAQDFRYPPKVNVTPFGNLEMKAVWKRTYAAADTVVTTGKFRDTVVSPWFEVPAASKFFFTYYIDGKHALAENGAKDTLRPNDSLNLNFQTSYNGYDVTTTSNLGTYLPSATDLDTVLQFAATLARDTICMRAPLIRAMVVMKDSSAAARAGLVGNTYSTGFKLYLNAKP